jgi:hypothetical protein
MILNTYLEDVTFLDSVVYCFIDRYSSDFTRDELETFRKVYGLILARQDKVANKIRKEWRK